MLHTHSSPSTILLTPEGQAGEASNLSNNAMLVRKAGSTGGTVHQHSGSHDVFVLSRLTFALSACDGSSLQ
jgi:hypothetical protein